MKKDVVCQVLCKQTLWRPEFGLYGLGFRFRVRFSAICGLAGPQEASNRIAHSSVGFRNKQQGAFEIFLYAGVRGLMPKRGVCTVKVLGSGALKRCYRLYT